MTVNLEISDQVLKSDAPELGRQILETVAIEGFKSNQLTLYQVRKILGFDTRFEVHEFLAEHGVPWVNYSVEDLERERKVLRELVGK